LKNWSVSSIVTIQTGRAYSPGIDDDLWGANGARIFPGVPRNGFNQPTQANVDLRLSRRFDFSESMSLEFFAEGFNIFNRQNITAVNTLAYIRPFNASTDLNFNTSPNPGGTFGDPTAAGSDIFRERQIQFSARFKF
jgi:predicted YcjX-like family ATPase